jgi:REP element-mobilizing transposase RayT
LEREKRGHLFLVASYNKGWQKPSVPRIPRGQQGGYAYHVINRGNGRTKVFHKPQDYEAFLSLLSEAKTRHGVKLFLVSVPNHFMLFWSRRTKPD